MPTTTKWGLRYPALTDTPDVPRDIQNLANDLDDVAKFSSGVLASRPVQPQKSGRYYYATDSGALYLSDGAAWVEVNPKDAVAATASLRTLGTSATQAAAGNDARFSDARTPTGAAGGDLAGTYPNPTILKDAAAGTASMRTLGAGATQAAAGNHTHSALTADQVAGTASIRTLGTGAQQAAAGNHNHDTAYAPRSLVGYKTGDTARSSFTTLTADPHLQLTGLAVGSYVFDAVIYYTSPAVADLQCRFQSSASVGDRYLVTRTVISGVGNQWSYSPVFVPDNTLFTSVGDDSTVMVVRATGSMEATAAGQSLTFEWAQQTSEAFSTTVLNGSYIRAERIT